VPATPVEFGLRAALLFTYKLTFASRCLSLSTGYIPEKTHFLARSMKTKALF
jgi:hypothetical protein